MAAAIAFAALLALVSSSLAATPTQRPGWALTPFEAAQVLRMGHQLRRLPGHDREYVDQVTCAPIGKAAWPGRYGNFKCSGTYRHWESGGWDDNPPLPITLYLAQSRTGLGTPCVSTEALPTSCPGSPTPNWPANGLLLYRIAGRGTPPAYHRCTDQPNRNGVYRCAYGTRDGAVMATVTLKPQMVTLQPTSLSWEAAECKIAPSRC